MNTFQAKKMIRLEELKVSQLERIAVVLEKIEARSDHFLVALSHVSA